MLGKFIICYIYDILIDSPSKKDHVTHVRRVLENYTFPKAEKCEFHVTTILFFGYFINTVIVLREHDKVTTIREWLIPTIVKGIQKFLGFANFNCQFTSGFGSFVTPLTALLLKVPRN